VCSEDIFFGGTSLIVISDVVYDHASFASDIDPSFFSL
jgi:hypothetical protein